MLSSLLPTFSLFAVTATTTLASELDLPNWSALDKRADNTTSTPTCNLDQSQPPGNLTVCGNATLFTQFRPKARFIAPEGWMNDPMGMFQRKDGSIHAGYQYHPQHIQWGNISQGAAHSPDFTFWTDFESYNGAKTIWPSEIYDIRGVFDGSIITDGIGGNPTILYTSTSFGPLGSTLEEAEGTETQSLAYTPDEGASWIKLPYGAGGNPVIYQWPESNLTGFRDPYVFQSARLTALLSNSTSTTNSTGDHFATISGGIHGDGARLFLYRQHAKGEFTKWDYLGPFLATELLESWSEWSGNYGINFETASVSRLNPQGDADDNGSDATAVDIVTMGTEQGRDSHEAHWPLWAAVDYSVRSNGSIESKILYSGVQDWGRSYAFTNFPVNGSRKVSVGWIYEDDENLILAKQQGYQGAFTLFRDLFIKVTQNVSPSSPGLYEKASWGVQNATDGKSVTVSTLGQKVVPETLTAYKNSSKVASLGKVKLDGTSSYQKLDTQPTGRHYALTGQFEFGLNSTSTVGFRVLASDLEYTDIMYDPVAENLTVVRTHSSLITSYGNDTEIAKLKLWELVDATTKTLNLTVFVDNSIIEVYANDEVAISTRAYPWLSNSTGAGFISQIGGNDTVTVKDVELWDGLINAWPARQDNSSQGLVWDGPTAALYGLWAGI